MVSVFIQNEAGSRSKNKHNEKTLEHLGSISLAQPYPFPYGFVLHTTAEDGDNVDCYVVTKSELRAGSIVTCRAAGLLEQFENGEADHKVLAVLPDEDLVLDEPLRNVLREFIETVSMGFVDKGFKVGRLLPRDAALRFIETHRSEETPPTT